MSVKFVCPNCGLETEVADQFVGQSGPCAGCGKQIDIPAARVAARNVDRGQASKKSQSTVLVVVIACVFLLTTVGICITAAVIVWPHFQTAKTVTRNQSRENLVRIGEAIKKYYEANGSFPPAYIADKDGRPMHSWRVLLLPYLGEEQLFAHYDMTQPWDSPQNQWLANQMPDVYGSPDDPDASFGETSYLVIHGDSALFNSEVRRRTRDVTDAPSSTIMVVESMGLGYSWLEPRDLELDNMPLTINSGQKGGIHNAKQRGGANALMVDGTVVRLSDQTPADIVRGMITIRGGENPPPAQFIEK